MNKRSLKGLFPLVSFLLFFILFVISAFCSRKKSSPVFRVDSLGISVPMRFALTGEEAQKYADDENTGAFYCINGKYVVVADHRSQGFKYLPYIKIGDEAYFGAVEYVCTGKNIGYSNHGLRLASGEELPYADLYAITCTDVEEYQVHIIFFEKK